MINIKYKLKESPIHGIGMFADQDIDEGQVVATSSPKLDVNISQGEFDSLESREQAEIEYWGFWDKVDNVWHVDFDNTKFINHSDKPSVTQEIEHKDMYLITTRPVKKGEELTQNYLEFESVESLKKRGIELD